MQLTLSGKQLLISTAKLPIGDLDFFQKIKGEDIPLNISMNNQITEDVLRGKKIDEKCPDITKIADIKSELAKCSNSKIKIKNITIELECV